MNTQIEQARAGLVSPPMAAAAAVERVGPEVVRDALASGRAVLPCNPAHPGLAPAVIGRQFRTKVNANIGRSTECSSPGEEMRKLQVAMDAGADCVMDLSVGPDLSELRRAMLAHCSLPFGTVPLYEAFARAGGSVAALDSATFLDVIREQAREGVDFMTLHAGLLRAHVPLAAARRLGIVSRGGAILAEWMLCHGRENPLFDRWEDVLAICHDHDVTVSLGDGLRPGCLSDASDAAQFAELDALGGLVRRCRAAGVQVMVEGPGHIPFNQIEENMRREDRVCDGAPFYVLGPVVTDVAAGHDHIASCIGATAAACHGAALLCYVTPAEHLGLPTEDDVREGVMAFRVAAHAADVAKGLPGARDWDDAMSDARRAMDWERQFGLAMDGKRAREKHALSTPPGAPADHCSMCGRDFCAIRTSGRIRERL